MGQNGAANHRSDRSKWLLQSQFIYTLSIPTRHNTYSSSSFAAVYQIILDFIPSNTIYEYFTLYSSLYPSLIFSFTTINLSNIIPSNAVFPLMLSASSCLVTIIYLLLYLFSGFPADYPEEKQFILSAFTNVIILFCLYILVPSCHF